jgi:hypothetical protein
VQQHVRVLAYLADANLTRANLDGADLTEADLSAEKSNPGTAGPGLRHGCQAAAGLDPTAVSGAAGPALTPGPPARQLQPDLRECCLSVG